MPATIEHDAQPGALSTITVANRSTTPLTVTVTARPWVQSASGKVSPNRRATLPGVSVDKTSFTLAPGEQERSRRRCNSAPSAGYLYGAIEAVGVPTDLSKRKGVVLGYRLVGALRICPRRRRPASPPARRRPSRAPRWSRSRTPATRSTRSPARCASRAPAARSRSRSRRPRSCPASRSTSRSAPSSPKGSYTATLSLKQRGKTALSATKKFKVK